MKKYQTNPNQWLFYNIPAQYVSKTAKVIKTNESL
jgi:hypothetical protein